MYTEATDHVELLQGPRSGEKLRCVAATFGASRRSYARCLQVHSETMHVSNPPKHHIMWIVCVVVPRVSQLNGGGAGAAAGGSAANPPKHAA